MAKADFDRFVERQTQPAPEWNFDRPKLLEEWLASLSDLYRQAEYYLDDYKREGKLRTAYSPIRIAEEFLGSYEAERLVVSVGRETITLVPVARMVIGARGRVDVEGSAGQSRLLRVPDSVRSPFGGIRFVRRGETPLPETAPEDEPIVWKLATLPPRLDLFPLSQDAFLSMLVEVSNG